MNGFIVLHRKMVDWEWYSDTNTKILFLHLLLTANWKDKNWKGTIIPRGSLITSLGNLSIDIGISIQSIRTSLERLKSTHEVTIKTTNKYTYISINNYNEYQELTSNLTNEQQTNNKQLTTTEQYNKETKKQEKEIIKEKLSLSDLNDTHFEPIAQKYGVPISFVRSKYDDMVIWHESSGKTKKDWIATLRGFVKRDAISVRKEANGRPNNFGKPSGGIFIDR